MPQNTFTTPYTPTSYLTVEEFKRSAVSANYKDLIPGGTTAQQDAALATLIRQASGYIDAICNQVLAPTIDIEARRQRPNRRGEFVVRPDNSPILEVRDVQWGYTPQRLVSVTDFESIWIEERMFTLHPSVFGASSVGSLEFGSGAPGDLMFLRYTYVNGWPCTTLTNAPIIGATTFTVASALGIYGGPATRSATATDPPSTMLVLYDGISTETVSVASVAGSTLTLNAGLQFAHTAGVLCSALPSVVNRACALMTAAIIQSRGESALVIPPITTPDRRSTNKKESAAQGTMDQAVELLDLAGLRRIR